MITNSKRAPPLIIRPYINGLDLLTSSAGLSADLVHPNVDGMAEISANLSEKMKEIMHL